MKKETLAAKAAPKTSNVMSAMQYAMDEANFMQEKMAIADSFTIIENDGSLELQEKARVRSVMANYNALLDAVAADNAVDTSIDSIITSRIICSFKLWHSMTDFDEVLQGLRRIESYCKFEDKEALHDVTTLLAQFDKDIKREIDNK